MSLIIFKSYKLIFCCIFFLFVSRIVVPPSKPVPESSKGRSTDHGSVKGSHSSNKPISQAGKSTLNTTENSPSRNQRVKEWISQNGLVNQSCDDSVFESDMNESASYNSPSEKVERGSKRVSSVSQISKASSVSNIRKAKSEAKLNYISDVKSEHENESVASFMPPPAANGNPTSSQFRNFSTPKVHSKQPLTRAHSLNRASSNQKLNKCNLSARRLIGIEDDNSGGATWSSSQGSDQLSVKFQGLHEQSSGSKHSSENKTVTSQNSYGRRSVSQQSERESKSQDWKYSSGTDSSFYFIFCAVHLAIFLLYDSFCSLIVVEARPPSNCGSARSVISSTKSSSKHTGKIIVHKRLMVAPSQCKIFFSFS